MFDYKKLPGELHCFYNPDIHKIQGIGTYLWPLRYFGEPYISPDGKLPKEHTEIVTTIKSNSTEIFITRNGGFFALVPEGITGTEENREPNFDKWDIFLGGFCSAVNKILCELTLQGVVSEPTSPAYVGLATIADNHAIIDAAVGMRESYWERIIGPREVLIHGGFIDGIKENVFQEIDGLQLASQLDNAKISPVLVVSAYSNYSKQQSYEAIASAWIIIEQIINYLWRQYVLSKVNNERKKRLEDKRTYTISVKIEYLMLLSVINQVLYENLHKCRNIRNNLMHKGTLFKDNSTIIMETLKDLIEIICKKDIAFPEKTQSMLLW